MVIIMRAVRARGDDQGMEVGGYLEVPSSCLGLGDNPDRRLPGGVG